MSSIKNILFDLGGVLLNIDYHKTAAAFEKLGAQNFDALYSQFKANALFEDLETGKISDEYFYQEMEKHVFPGTQQPQIEAAWNAMLLDFRVNSLDFLDFLKSKYHLFLLSNTNSIHHAAFQRILFSQTGKHTLDGYFSKSYYSHLINMRKPWAETYEFVLKDAGIERSETLFIDDSINNIEAAIELGIPAHHLKVEERIENLGL